MSTRQSNLVLFRDLFLFLLGSIVVIGFIVFFWKIFFPFALSIIIAFLLSPLIGKMTIRFNMKRATAVLIVYLIFFCLIGFGLYFSIPIIIKEILAIRGNFPTYLTYLQNYLNQLITRIHLSFPSIPLDRIDIVGKFNQNASIFMVAIFKNMPALVHSVLDSLMLLILVPFITFFLLKDGLKLKKKIYELIPNAYYELYRNLSFRMSHQLNNYIRGQTLDALICGLMTTFGLGIIGVKYFFIIGMFAGIANLIPYFGPFMGLVPAVIVTILERGFVPDFLLLIVFVILCVQLIDNLAVNPIVVGNSVELHPLIVMIAIMVGGAVGGLFAMLLVVPFVSIVRIVLIELIHEIRYRNYMRLSQLKSGDTLKLL